MHMCQSLWLLCVYVICQPICMAPPQEAGAKIAASEAAPGCAPRAAGAAPAGLVAAPQPTARDFLSAGPGRHPAGLRFQPAARGRIAAGGPEDAACAPGSPSGVRSTQLSHTNFPFLFSSSSLAQLPSDSTLVCKLHRRPCSDYSIRTRAAAAVPTVMGSSSPQPRAAHRLCCYNTVVNQK